MNLPDPAPFDALVPRYRAFLFDSYGVLRTEQGLLAGVQGTLTSLREQNRPAWVVTNDASRTHEAMAEPFGDLFAPERFVSTGGLAADFLEERHPGQRIAYLGPLRSAPVLERTGSPVRPLPEVEDLAWVDVVVLMDEAGFEWERELSRLVNLVRRRPDLPLLAPNPDLVFPRGGGEVGLASGALSALLEAVLGRAPVHFGKPAPAIYQKALALARAELPGLRPEQVLMVGDTLQTDIAGAQGVGLATALTLCGNTTPDTWREAIATSGVTPDHVVPGIGLSA